MRDCVLAQGPNTEFPPPVYPEVSPDGDQLKWSEDEAFLRMGLFSGISDAETYRPSELGGSQIQRRIPRYMADKRTEDRSCVKHKTASSSHTPGMSILPREVLYRLHDNMSLPT